MNMETIREWLNRRPFEAFQLRLSDGEVHEIRHPENVIVMKSRLIIGYPEADRAVHISLIHVSSIEKSQAA